MSNGPHLSADIRNEIQTAYSSYLESRELAPRSGQKQMIAEIARALAGDGDRLLAIEAGTGTGKTIAYLLPALVWAKQTGRKLVVSTATIALQEQLTRKDVPEVREHSGLDFTYALVKGRGRYLCNLKLENLLAGEADDPTSPLFETGARTFERELLKLYRALETASIDGSWDGDRDHWDTEIDDRDWSPLTSDRYQCVGRRCSAIRRCAFYRAREEIDDVDLLITNHDLVLADLRLGGGAILPPPEESIYVFDEGHHLSDRARNHFARSYRLRASRQQIDGQARALVEWSRGASPFPSLAAAVQEVIAALDALDEPLCQALAVADELAAETKVHDGVLRFPLGSPPAGLVETAAPLASAYRALSGRLESLDAQLLRQIEEGRSELQAWYPSLGQWRARTSRAQELWQAYATAESTSIACHWLRRIDNAADLELHCAPVLAAGELREHLWGRCHAAIVTSATLTALGTFDRFRLHSGFPVEAGYVAIPSPFDFGRVTLAVAGEACDPRVVDHHDEVLAVHLPRLLDPLQGNLVLFSSVRQLSAVYEALPEGWRQRILRQGDLSREAMVIEHRRRIDSGQGSTLFGLASFAEGIDLPGAYCEHVVIAKIPFSVPDQPVEAALGEWIAERGGNAFAEVSLPDASVRLIQAVGRLMRSETDGGQVTVFDQRLAKTGYGRQLLKALPPCRLLIASPGDLAAAQEAAAESG